jgi:hypothetical protein
MDNNFIQNLDDLKNSTSGSGTITTTGGNTVSWSILPMIGPNIWQACYPKPKNPYIPKEILVNEEQKVVVVKWEDDTETKVTCDSDDTFSADAGFSQALKYKIFGGKDEYKEKWWNIISKKISWMGNISRAKEAEEARKKQQMKVRKEKENKRKTIEKNKKVTELSKRLGQLKTNQ